MQCKILFLVFCGENLKINNKVMFPKKLHIEQIERFHGAIDNISKQLELETDEKVKLDLLKMYFTLTDKVWVEVDDFTERLKIMIDNILF